MGVVNTTKSLFRKAEAAPVQPIAESAITETMPIDAPAYVPPVDDGEAEDDTDREGQTDPGANTQDTGDTELNDFEAFLPEVKLTQFRYLSIGSNQGQIHVTGTASNGENFSVTEDAGNGLTILQLVVILGAIQSRFSA